MIWVVINKYASEKFIDANMKHLGRSMRTHKVFLEMFHTSSFSYSANVKAKLEFFPHTPQL
jgi:hypothetical protein